MNFRIIALPTLCLLTGLVAACGNQPPQEIAASPPKAPVQEAPAPTADEQVAGLEAMCAEAQTAIAARQATSSLYERVGGRESLHTMVAETVRLHQINDPIKRVMEGVDPDHLTKQVTDFLVIATGGEGEYDGRDMVAAHAHLNLSNADFLAAGGDLGQGMTFAGWGDDEQQELLCAFVGLRPHVVTTEG